MTAASPSSGTEIKESNPMGISPDTKDRAPTRLGEVECKAAVRLGEAPRRIVPSKIASEINDSKPMGDSSSDAREKAAAAERPGEQDRNA
jgi:hypothetical protein